MAQHVARRDAQLLREKAPEGAVVGRAERPDGHQVQLRVEPESLLTDVAVEVNRELRYPQHRPVHPDQPDLRAVRGTHHRAPGQAEVPVEPGIEQRATVDLDAKLAHADPAGVRARLDAQRRAVGVRAQQPERRVRRRSPRNHPCEHRAAVTGDVTPAAGRPVPVQRDLGEARRDQPATGLGRRVVRRRRRVDERDQVQCGLRALLIEMRRGDPAVRPGRKRRSHLYGVTLCMTDLVQFVRTRTSTGCTRTPNGERSTARSAASASCGTGPWRGGTPGTTASRPG